MNIKLIHFFFISVFVFVLFSIYIMQFSIGFLEFGFGSFYPSLLSHFGYLDNEIANLLLVSTLSLLLLKPMLGNISDRYGYRKPVILGFIMTSMFIIGMTLFNNFIAHFIFISFIIAAMTVFYAAMNSHTAHVAPEESRGIAMGTLGVYTSLGRGLSTLVIGYFTSVFDIIIAFQVFALIAFVIALLFILLSRK